MTHPLAQAAKALAEAADALFAHANAGRASIPQQPAKPDLFNPFADDADHIAAVQKAHPDWRTIVPSTRDVMQATDLDKGSAVRLRRLLVALADFETSLNDRAATLAAIKRAYPRWRTEMPSARTLAAFVGASSSSTGQRLLNALRQELLAEQTRAV